MRHSHVIGTAFFVGISKVKRIDSCHVTWPISFSHLMINLLLSRNLKVLFCRNSFWFLKNELLIKNPTKKQFQFETFKSRLKSRFIILNEKKTWQLPIFTSSKSRLKRGSDHMEVPHSQALPDLFWKSLKRVIHLRKLRSVLENGRSRIIVWKKWIIYRSHNSKRNYNLKYYVSWKWTKY